NPKEQDSKEGQSRQSKQQDKGLDTKPTPGSDQKESKPSENKTGQAGARGASDQKGVSAGAAEQAQPDQKQLTPEEQDALRVLNALAEEKPDQFKKMFRFQGKGTGKKAERDW
ncbi:hypothetical protein HYR69_02900, partial [Candidatus Sumerlaeota bacterium]|nr:hypothetical protein [Candidatus Sumerlaeota bacterium]